MRTVSSNVGVDVMGYCDALYLTYSNAGGRAVVGT